MYVKVHKRGSYWFRDDNGAWLGKDMSGLMSSRLQIRDEIIIPVKGYLDEDGFFIPVCTINPNLCTYYCILRNTFKFKDIVCPCKHSKDPTFGYYANIPYYLTLT